MALVHAEQQAMAWFCSRLQVKFLTQCTSLAFSQNLADTRLSVSPEEGQTLNPKPWDSPCTLLACIAVQDTQADCAERKTPISILVTPCTFARQLLS